jgi:hypothetical protein
VRRPDRIRRDFQGSPTNRPAEHVDPGREAAVSPSWHRALEFDAARAGRRKRDLCWEWMADRIMAVLRAIDRGVP